MDVVNRTVVNLDNFFGYRVITVDPQDFDFVWVGIQARGSRPEYTDNFKQISHFSSGGC